MTLLQADPDVAGLPKLKRHYDALADTLRREAAARRRFRASLESLGNARVEFINGEVVTQMPAKVRHINAVKYTARLADTYVTVKKLGAVHTEQSLTEFPRNDFEPDICFWKKSKSKQFGPDQVILPVPDFVAEVLSPTTERVDRGVKFRDYEENGVGEYWIIDPVARSIEQHVLRDGRFELVGQFTKGAIRSHVIKGFAMPVRAAFDEAENLAALRKMLAK